MLAQNAVDGAKLSKLRNEGQIVKALGVQCIADATRTMQVLRNISSGNGVPAPVDITVPGHATHPATWSIEQFHQHASQEAGPEIADLLKKHKFAGDVIATVGIDGVTILLGLTLDQEVVFADLMHSLRDRIAESL